MAICRRPICRGGCFSPAQRRNADWSRSDRQEKNCYSNTFTGGHVAVPTVQVPLLLREVTVRLVVQRLVGPVHAVVAARLLQRARVNFAAIAGHVTERGRLGVGPRPVADGQLVVGVLLQGLLAVAIDAADDAHEQRDHHGKNDARRYPSSTTSVEDLTCVFVVVVFLSVNVDFSFCRTEDHHPSTHTFVCRFIQIHSFIRL